MHEKVLAFKNRPGPFKAAVVGVHNAFVPQQLASHVLTAAAVAAGCVGD